MACQTRLASRSLTAGELLMVRETVAMETLASAATVRMSGVLAAVLRVPLRTTSPSLKELNAMLTHRTDGCRHCVEAGLDSIKFCAFARDGPSVSFRDQQPQIAQILSGR